MSPKQPEAGRPRPDARLAVADAIQNLMAARLGRGFIPLAMLFGLGAVGVLRSSPDGWWTVLGAASTAGAMLAYGLRIVQKSLGRAHRAWMSVAMLGSLVPPAFALYALAWRGLRGYVAGSGGAGFALATLYLVLGVWVLRSWMRVVEIERLARVMSMNLPGEGESV